MSKILHQSYSDTAIKQNTESDKEKMDDQITVERWLQIRKEAGLKIDPETAGVAWWYGLGDDPYGMRTELAEERDGIGREYFACSPGSDIWVNFSDLPKATRDALWEKYKSRLAFPAGLPRLHKINERD
jgi:hypothetical protein